MESWRFLNTGFAEGAFNMAVDEVLLAGVESGDSPPTVRVYGWTPPAVSTGHSQKIGRELDLERCRRAGVDVVRRPTGGRAVLHAGELTYSVAGPSGRAPLGSSIAESYRAIADALLRGLAELGVEATLTPVPTAPTRRDSGASPPCFVSAGRFEVVVGGRKLIGSAQRRVGSSVLQHGSLLLDPSHEGLADLLKVERESDRETIRRALSLKTTNLAEVLGRAVEFGEIVAPIRRGFETAFCVELHEGCLSERESEKVGKLATRCEAPG